MQSQSLLGPYHTTSTRTYCQLLLVGRQQPVASAANAEIVSAYVCATCCQLSRSCNLLLAANCWQIHHTYIAFTVDWVLYALFFFFFYFFALFWFCVSFFCTRVVCQLFTALTSSPSACACLLQLLLSLHTFYYTYIYFSNRIALYLCAFIFSYMYVCKCLCLYVRNSY